MWPEKLTRKKPQPNEQPGAAKFIASRDPRPAGGSAGAERSGASAAGPSADENKPSGERRRKNGCADRNGVKR